MVGKAQSASVSPGWPIFGTNPYLPRLIAAEPAGSVARDVRSRRQRALKKAGDH
jgi:hypothetical protein